MIAFVGGRKGQGWHLYTMTDDGSQLRCLTESIHTGDAIFFSPQWSPDGSSLAFTFKEHSHSPYSQVCTINLDRNEVMYLTPSDGFCFATHWLSKGFIVYHETIMDPPRTQSYVCFMQGDGSDPERILQFMDHQGASFSAGCYHDITVSPDGKKIAMVSWLDHQIYLSEEGSRPDALKLERLNFHRIRWASDNNTLAFTATRGEAMVYEHLYVSRDDGTDFHRVGRILVESDFSWSPNIEHIAFVSTQGGEFTVNIVDVLTEEKRRIATIELNPESGDTPSCPVWSSAGDDLLYTTYPGPYVHLYRYNIATGQAEIILGDEGRFTHLSDLSIL